MKELIIWVYNYVTWKPQNGAICGGFGYILAIKAPALSDQELKVVASLSAVVTCLISCVTLLSLIIKGAIWCTRQIRLLAGSAARGKS